MGQQGGQPPEKAIHALHKKFPHATDFSWQMKANAWRVGFLEGELYHEVTFDEKLHISRHDMELDQEDLPDGILKKIAKKAANPYFEQILIRQEARGRKMYLISLETDRSSVFIKASSWGRILEWRETPYSKK